MEIIHQNLIIGLIRNAMIKGMLSTGREGDTETTKVRDNLNQMRVAGKDYKVIINKVKAAEKHKFIQELRAKETKDPKSFWQILNTNSSKIKMGNVTIEDFFEHFFRIKLC